MQNIRQTTASVEVSNAPIELSLDQLQHVAGGLGPNDNWTASIVQGPNDNWGKGPNDNWCMGPNDNW